MVGVRGGRESVNTEGDRKWRERGAMMRKSGLSRSAEG